MELRFCKHCDSFHIAPPMGVSNDDWLWIRNERSKGGGYHKCKKLLAELGSSYRRSENGWAVTQWNTQKRSSKKRGHPAPNYNSEQLFKWAKEQPNFAALFSSWVQSGYERDLKPSCDRIDDSKPYTFGNLRIVTQKENVLIGARSEKAKKRMKTAVQLKMAKEVEKYDLDMNLLDSYLSAGEAGRSNGIYSTHITKCCLGKQKTAGGYIWRHKKPS